MPPYHGALVETLIYHALAKTVMDMMGFGRRARQGTTKRVVIEQRSQKHARRARAGLPSMRAASGSPS